MGTDASQIKSHRADVRRLRISIDCFYRIAHVHFKTRFPPHRENERGNPDVTLSDSPAPFPCIRSGLVGFHRYRYGLRWDLLLGLLCGRRLPAQRQDRPAVAVEHR